MIESLQNDKIKYINRLLTDNRFRKKEKIFVVEGSQENQRAQDFYYKPIEFFICENLFKGKTPNAKINFVSEKVYEKLAYRGTSEGIIGIYEHELKNISTFNPKENSTIIIIESVEKPGNLGAILRSCEAFGIDALIVTDAKLDLYNPNVIRSSVGCLFGMNVYQSSNEETYQFICDHNFNLYTTLMDETVSYFTRTDLREKSAIAFGTEHSGLSNFWKGKGKNTLIQMTGTIDSLNLSNAVAIVCHEALRQKENNY